MDQAGHCQVFGNFKQGSPMMGSARSLEGRRQGWRQEDQRQRGAHRKEWEWDWREGDRFESCLGRRINRSR